MRVGLVVLLLAASLAGCAEETGPQEESDDTAFEGLEGRVTEDTGLIRGLVLDDAIVPVAGATVTLQGEGRTAETTEEGAFLFDDLAPGTYFMTVEKLGYNTTQTSANVEAGVERPDIIKVKLIQDKANQPFVEAAQFDGFIMCSGRGIVIGLAICSTVGVGDDDFVRNYEPSFRPAFIQSELTWRSTQALGDALSYSITCIAGPPCPDGQVTIARHEGKSPLLLQVNATQAEDFLLGAGEQPITLRVFAHGMEETDVPEETVYDTAGIDCVRWPVLFADCIRFGGVGMTIDQQFTGYTHMFNLYTPPEDWRFTEDGNPPGPPS
ncbi:MAG: carboxypeptidase-like regulatory domain-containing protein [Thermoplasmatota archaeon]